MRVEHCRERMLVCEVVETPRDSELGEREVRAREVRGRMVLGNQCRRFAR